MKQHNVASLPKWAQSRIEVLENSVARWKKVQAEVAEGDSDIFVEDRSSFLDEDDTALPRETSIRFVFDKDKNTIRHGRPGEIRVHFREDARGKRLEISARDGRLVIHPVVTNTISVEVDVL